MSQGGMTMRTVTLLTFAMVAFAGPCWAGEDETLMTGRSVAVSCESQVPVCGVMGKDRMISYANECQAHEAGAVHIISGGCFDQE